MNKNLIGVLYVSTWVIIWGTIGSLIDYPLLKLNVYLAGSIGQLTTFSLTAFVSLLIAIKIFPSAKKIFRKSDIEG